MLKHTGKFAAVSVLIATLTLLSACSTFSRMEQGLDALVGKQDKTAFLILGKPASQTNTNNYKQYTWLIHRPDVAI
ncbi:MAG: hypothetical protein OEZ33_08810, partial [Gammaproteobacteria bacterium]|nr:hypothetical protein [Gammaproteobacteria bacterium]